MHVRMLIVMASILAAPAAARAETDAATLAALTRSLMSDDSHERVSAVVGLQKLGADARPALPALRAAMEREQDVQTRALMLRAINDIERGGPAPRAEPTDVAAQAHRLAALIDDLSDAEPDTRLAAMDDLRQMGALALPAIERLQHVADTAKDRDQKNAALAAIAGIRRELWFHEPGSGEKTNRAAPKSPKATRVDLYAATMVATLWELTGKLADDDAKVRLRAVRQIAGYGAAADIALPTLRRLSADDGDTMVRKLAALAAEKVEAAVAATAAIRAADEGDEPPAADHN